MLVGAVKCYTDITEVGMLSEQFKIFHGSNAVLSEGDIITPGYHGEFGEGAYATSDPDFAGIHAAAAAMRGKTTESDRFSQPSLFGTVYEVEHLSEPHEVTRVEGLVADEIIDPKGLRVKGVHSYRGVQ